MLINVLKGEMAIFGEPPQAPDDLLSSGALYLPRLVRRPGLLQIQQEAAWRATIPPELIRIRTLLNKAISDHRYEGDSRVFLMQVKHHEAERSEETEGSEGLFVLTFWVAHANEPEIRDRLKEMEISNLEVDLLAGSAQQIPALIAAAWTAWCDLPYRHEDQRIREFHSSGPDTEAKD
jgi:hypothetical protein